jgi:hypothetical protein
MSAPAFEAARDELGKAATQLAAAYAGLCLALAQDEELRPHRELLERAHALAATVIAAEGELRAALARALAGGET